MGTLSDFHEDIESVALRLVADYREALMAEALQLCNDRSNAEDLVFRTLEVLFRGNQPSGPDRGAPMIAWLRGVMRRIHRDSQRGMARAAVVYLDPETLQLVADANAEAEPPEGTHAATDPAAAVQAREDAETVREAVDSLPPRMREAIVLRYFESVSIAQMASVLRISQDAVKCRLYYARKVLARRLRARIDRPGAKALLVALALAVLTAAGAAVLRVATAPASSERQIDTCDDVGAAATTATIRDGEGAAATFAAVSPVHDQSLVGAAPSAPSPFTTQPQENTMKHPPAKTTVTRSLAAATASFALAAVPAAQATDIAYRPPSATPYTWTGGKWITNDSNKTEQPNPPTTADNVFVWANKLKANSSDVGNPLCVAGGEVALTKNFTLGWTDASLSTSAENKILFEIQNGGVMTNAGPVKLGVAESGASQTNPGGLATVRSGGLWVATNGVTVGASSSGNRNRIVIEQGGSMEADSGKKEFIIANVADHNACVTNAGTFAAYDFFVGGYGNGDFENSGDFTVGRKFTIGRQAGSTGHVRHSAGTFSKGTPSSQPLYVGYSGTGVFEVFAPLSLQRNERLILGSQGTGEGTLVLGTGGTIDNVTNVLVGANSDGGRGHLQMAGGTLTVQLLSGGYQLFVGKINSSGTTQKAWGDIRGHGIIARDTTERSLRLKLYGQVVAEGGDLDLSSVKTVGDSGVDANMCGTNGWYAVNGGRLLYPAAQDFSYAEHATIGDYVYRGGDGSRTDPTDITLVNSLQLRLYDATGAQQVDNGYNHAALYAPDRNDIPGTVPGAASTGDIMLGVWRLGHFDAPGDIATSNAVPFDKAWLRFRVDVAALPDDIDWSQFKVRLYRWDGSAWQIVGKADGSDMPYVETRATQPSYAGVDADGKTWNIGWYAAALVRNGAFTLIIR